MPLPSSSCMRIQIDGDVGVLRWGWARRDQKRPSGRRYWDLSMCSQVCSTIWDSRGECVHDIVATPDHLRHHHIRGVSVTNHTTLIVTWPHCQHIHMQRTCLFAHDVFTCNTVNFLFHFFSFAFVITLQCFCRTRPNRNNGGCMRFGTTR